MAASSSSSSRIPWSVHDVFLSFRGADTRTSFTSHLLAALDRQRFSTYRDDTKLPRGEHITSELLKAIEESRVSIVVFSKKYADSEWCLDELVKIMECRRDFKRIVLPIFYDVDPYEVAEQGGCYSQFFDEHENGVKQGTLSRERVEGWRAALIEAANLSAYDLRHRDETKLIKEVVEDIVKRLDQLYSHVTTHPVGIESRVRKLKAQLNLGSDDVRIVAIWGVGGLGKTTIAKAIFNCIRNEFEGYSFLADVSEMTKKSSRVVKLQKQLLSNVLKEYINNFDNYHQGIELIKKHLCHRRVLLVLDDVDHGEQLKMLAINRDFFGPGSRIIITTRNMTSLTSLPVNSVYSPKQLNDDESLKLFSLHAFNKDYLEESQQKISNEIVAYAEGIPLVLEVLGSFLIGRSTAEWKSEHDKLKVIPNGDIQRKLKISFDSLDDKNQELFLDIAFFFIGRDKDFTVKVLEDSGYFPESGIGELARRCLVRVEAMGMLRMHDVLRDMGREIVRQQSLKKPGNRSRLSDREEALQVLKDCTGTKAVEGLSLELHASNNEHVDTKAFANMSKLRFLHLNYLQCLSGTYITPLRNLKWLCWDGFPLTSLPAALYMENLVAIDLQYSKLKQIWIEPKRLDKLRFLNLSHSYHLTKTPDFAGLKSLEMLLLNDCTSLVKLDNSIGCLHKLLELNVANCIKLCKVPYSLFMLKSLESLDFSGCSKLGELAEGKGRFSMLRQRLTKCQEYIPIPMTSIQGLSCLQELNLAWCNMEYVPSGISSLTTLKRVDFTGNRFCSLPSNFNHLSRLETLRLDRCVQLKSLADLPTNLDFITANSCVSLETVRTDVGTVPNSSRRHQWGMYLVLRNCPKLDSKSLSNNFKRNFLHMHQERCRLAILGGELPNDIQFQGIGRRSLSFVVPPMVGKKIKGFIACAIISYRSSLGLFDIVNKTKGTTSSIHNMNRTCAELIRNQDHVLIIYEPICKPYFTLEGGDEADLIWGNDRYPVVKRLGLSLIYEDDDKYLESNY